MYKWMRLVVVVVIAMLLAACSASTSQQTNKAPQFELQDIQGNTVSLEKLEGKKVYIKFWASWCSICLAGMEELNELASQKQDFEVLTIVSPNYNGEMDREAFTRWISGVEQAANTTILLDDDGVISKKFEVLAYPTSAYIGSDGTLIEAKAGHVNNEYIIKRFSEIE